MTKLFLVTKGQTALDIPEEPFANEVEDLEAFVKDNAQILGDRIVIFARQVDTGVGGRIDLLGLDSSRPQPKLVLIELKNKPADSAVLLQVLRYANWISGNRDSIRLLLERNGLTAKNCDLEPRIVVIAPELLEDVVELSQHMKPFEFTFLQIKRFKFGSKFVVAVQPRVGVPKRSAGVTDRREWDWARYESDLGWSVEVIKSARELVSRLELVTQGWKPKTLFRKGDIWLTCFDYAAFGVTNFFKRLGLCIWFELTRNPEKPLPDGVTAEYKELQGTRFLYVCGNIDRLSDDQLRRLCEAALRQAGLLD